MDASTIVYMNKVQTKEMKIKLKIRSINLDSENILYISCISNMYASFTYVE